MAKFELKKKKWPQILILEIIIKVTPNTSKHFENHQHYFNFKIKMKLSHFLQCRNIVKTIKKIVTLKFH